ncbi:CheR family methyltransferase [Alkalilimnicola sp. S0819]|uniref:CheR family methyltransferase n=1 Tax=Alkalilimnicola sp. S0819 TaxID=2613922 RepID=UPI001261E9A3|nr:CheR family methyltransferase [Alkalilimnicola sp. S0819]KAB7624476.1 protein-glutamate O-methyltransferase CheR [Alkalilimnicola sp. S0819]MPQ16312.1 protein-glutamate O-methyltransferase CheR [Alkalilimnicola sp. S0819]
MATAEHNSQPVYWGGLEKLPDMDGAQFDQWVALLHDRTGMNMPPERKSFLMTSVGLRMREVGYEDYQSYYEYLTSGQAGAVEWTALVDRLTVHETRFFRDPRAVEFLRQHWLPGAIERAGNGETVQLWSAGCSTGEEPFTLAMVLDEAFLAERIRGYYAITATDISLYSLATGKEAAYPARRLNNIPEPYRSAYCEPLDGGGFRIMERLRRRTCFAFMNLLEVRHAPLAPMDLIYCQNVLIYFDRERREQILNGLVRHLRVGGLLVLGAGEMIGWSHPQMMRVADTDVLAFRREADQARVRL